VSGGSAGEVAERRTAEVANHSPQRHRENFLGFVFSAPLWLCGESLLGELMATLGLIEYKDASPEVRAVYDDIMATRKTDWVNNFWKAIAHDPVTLKRTWEDIKQIMAPGALDPLIKEMIYVAVSVTNQCHYCIASHTVSAQKKGMTDAMFKELMAVVGMANETNKMVTGYQVEIDEQFKNG
jgi:AhpD family alkylhydroperoxidase